MRELRDYLYSQAVADFKPSELSEPLLSVYNFIESALRDDCDALRFDARGVTCCAGMCR